MRKKYHTVVERGKINISHIPILGSGTIQRVEVKPVLWAKISQVVYAKNSI
jgi:hypothetical protein